MSLTAAATSVGASDTTEFKTIEQVEQNDDSGGGSLLPFLRLVVQLGAPRVQRIDVAKLQFQHSINSIEEATTNLRPLIDVHSTYVCA